MASNHHREAVILAALLHDIGKFSQRARQQLQQHIKNLEHAYCPRGREFYTHRHSLHTAQFFEESFEQYSGDVNIDTIKEWAAKHHLPEEMFPEQSIIAEADRLSSGMDRKQPDEELENAGKTFRHIPLRSIFSMLRLERDVNVMGFHQCHTRRPDSRQPLTIVDNEHTPPEQYLSPALEEQFSEQWNAFKNEFTRIRFESWSQYLLAVDNILSLYTTTITSSSIDLPTVSLYDHARTTAAIASALYDYHSATDTLYAESITNREKDKFRWVSGDFSGIQRFIFNIHESASKGVAKLLRARSFIVSALTHMAIVYLCRRADIPLQNLVMESAGRFVVLVPNLEAKVQNLEAAFTDMQQWLLDKYLGMIQLNFDCSVQFSPAELQRHRFKAVWQSMLDAVDAAKRRPLHRLLVKGEGWDAAAWLPMSDKEYALYRGKADPVTGHYPPGDGKDEGGGESDEAAPNERSRLEISLGAELAKKEYRYLIFSYGEDRANRDKNSFAAFSNPAITLTLSSQPGDSHGTDTLSYYINPDSSTADINHKSHYIANYMCRIESEDEMKKYRESQTEGVYQQEPGAVRTFQQIALHQLRPDPAEKGTYRGNPLLAVLKADVDNMGLLFAHGQEEWSLSEMVTLSRELDLFFTALLPYRLREERKNMYTVFSGGDDLFFIGDWKTIMDFAPQLRTWFAEYTAHNPNFTLSGAIHFIRPHYPIRMAAEEAEQLLETHAKATRPGSIEKDNVRIINDTLQWEEMRVLLKEARTLNAFAAPEEEPAILSSGMLYRLLTLNGYYRDLVFNKNVMAAKYRAMLRYFIGRNIGTYDSLIKKKRKRSDAAKDNTVDKKLDFLKFLQKYEDPNPRSIINGETPDFNTYMAYFHIPLTYVLYNNRKRTMKGGEE